MRFGCHISTKNGYLGAARTAKAIGAAAFQYFPKNPRSLRIKKFDHRDAERCAAFCAEHNIASVGHSAYGCNLAAEKHQRQAVIDCLLNDLDITNACGSIGTVVHFGAYHGDDPLEGYKRMIDTLNEILFKWDGDSFILIENNAGKGDQMGLTLEELVKIRELTERPEKIGFCFDTCHAFAAGLWTGTNWTEVMDKGKEIGYFQHLKVVHLNNSVYPAGSRRDRHANLKSGQIKLEHLLEFCASEVIRELPLILETPSSDSYSHIHEINDLKSWMPQTS